MIFNSYNNCKNYVDNMTQLNPFKNIIKIIRSNNLGRKGLKKRISDLKKSSYGKGWQKIDQINYEWYETLFNRTPLIHKNFINFLKEKNDINTVLEIGCGTGIYPIKFKELFFDKRYVGIDISKPAIEYCTKQSEFDFICGDFIKLDIKDEYDLVFSHSVIDHVYDIDSFLSKIVRITKKYAYVTAYRGYFPTLKQHRSVWDNENGCYFNDLSVNRIKHVLMYNNLIEEEFSIEKQQSGIELNKSYSIGLDGSTTVMKINKINIQ